MEHSVEVGGRLELECHQDVFLVLGEQRQDPAMLITDGNLIAFESLWHAGSLIHDLHSLGGIGRMVTMRLDILYYLAEGMDLGLWVLRHDGTILSVDDIYP